MMLSTARVDALFPFDSQGVMSGIITTVGCPSSNVLAFSKASLQPYFKAAFHNPTPYELGTMVAILEIGAFSMRPSPDYQSYILIGF